MGKRYYILHMYSLWRSYSVGTEKTLIRCTFSFKTDGDLPKLAATILCLEQVVVITERAFSQSHLVLQLHPFLDNSEATHASVTSQLNIGLLLKTIQELQLVQNAVMLTWSCPEKVQIQEIFIHQIA